MIFTVIFAFCLLSFLSVFITLSSSLAVTRVTKDLRFNPYQRAGSILIARTATLLQAAPSVRGAILGFCSGPSNNTWSCITNGSNQSRFAEVPVLGSYACNANADLGLTLERGITTCLRELQVTLNPNGQSFLAVTSSTGKNNGFVRVSSRINLTGSSFIPAYTFLSPGISTCPNRVIDGSGTVQGDLLAYCNNPSGGRILGNNTTLTGQVITPGPVSLMWPAIASTYRVANIAVATTRLSDISTISSELTASTAQCSTATGGLNCQTTTSGQLSNQIRVLQIPSCTGGGSGTCRTVTAPTALRVDGGSLTVRSGAAVIATCRNLDFRNGVSFSTGTSTANTATSGSILFIAAKINRTGTNSFSLVPCNQVLSDQTLPDWNIQTLPSFSFANLSGAVSVVAPGSSLSVQGGSSALIYGSFVAGTLNLTGQPTLRNNGLATVQTSDTVNIVTTLFQQLIQSSTTASGFLTVDGAGIASWAVSP